MENLELNGWYGANEIVMDGIEFKVNDCIILSCLLTDYCNELTDSTIWSSLVRDIEFSKLL